jgi:excisionase family DNA binding protein
MMTPKEAAAALGVSRRTITNYFNRGILTPVKITDRHVLVLCSEVEALLSGRAVRDPATGQPYPRDTGASNLRAPPEDRDANPDGSA